MLLNHRRDGVWENGDEGCCIGWGRDGGSWYMGLMEVMVRGGFLDRGHIHSPVLGSLFYESLK